MATTATKPPGFKELPKACADCKHFNGKDLCQLYNYPVDDEDTCDSFTPGPEDEATNRLWKAHRRRLSKEK